MNDFFDKLGAAAKRAASTVSTEVSVAAEEQKIREQYQVLGKLYFRAKRTGEETEGLEFADCCRKIEASLKRINELKRGNEVSDVSDKDDDYVTVE